MQGAQERYADRISAFPVVDQSTIVEILESAGDDADELLILARLESSRSAGEAEYYDVLAALDPTPADIAVARDRVTLLLFAAWRAVQVSNATAKRDDPASQSRE